MDGVLQDYWERVAVDGRLSPAHGLLYLFFCFEWESNKRQRAVEFTRAKMMKRARIAGIATYHKCMKDLIAFGYIRYEPSFNPEVKNKVWVL